MQMVESTESLSDYNKSSSSGGWYHRSRGAGWLSLLTGARWLRGGSRAPQTKGTLAPCTPGTATMGNIKGRLEPRQPKSWGGGARRPMGTQSRWVPVLGTLGDPPAFVPTSQSPNTQPGHLRRPPTSSRAGGQAGFSGVWPEAEGPHTQNEDSPRWRWGERGIPAEPERGRGGTPQMKALGRFVIIWGMRTLGGG